MGLETGTYVIDLVTSNPVGATDQKSQGDDHLRLIKTVLKNTFPNAIGPWEQSLSDDTATAGPFFTTFRHSGTPAADDLLGGLKSKGRSSTGVERIYSQFVGKIKTPTNGAENGGAELQVLQAGVLASLAEFSGQNLANFGPGMKLLKGSVYGTELTNSYSPVLSVPVSCNIADQGAQWVRFGDFIVVFGRFTMITASATSFGFRFSLPVATNIIDSFDLFGMSMGDTFEATSVFRGEVTSNTAICVGRNPSITPGDFAFWFGYRLKT